MILISAAVCLSSCRWRSASWWTDSKPEKGGRIFRYDRLVDEYVSLNSFTSLRRMNTEYPAATRLLIEDVLAIGSVHDPRIEQRLREYYLDSTMQALLDDVHEEYADLDAEEEEISSVFRKIKKADPGFRIPFMYAQISGLNQSIVVGDSLLGISLDKYLGRDYPLYRKYYRDYQCRAMDRSCLVPDALFYYLSHEYPLPAGKAHTLLECISDYGKIHWVIARCRDIPPEQEAGFDEQSVSHYRGNEAGTWNWMREHGVTASTDLSTIKLFTEPRETVPYMGKDAPGRIGLWMGLQIIDHYMKSHPGVTIGELLHEKDYEKVLRESGYRPSATGKE